MIKSQIIKKLIIQKIMKDQKVDEATANSMFEDNWAGMAPPLDYNVPVRGELKFYLPQEAVGTAQQDQTENPFNPPQNPEPSAGRHHHRGDLW